MVTVYAVLNGSSVCVNRVVSEVGAYTPPPGYTIIDDPAGLYPIYDPLAGDPAHDSLRAQILSEVAASVVSSVGVTIDGAGSVISTGVVGYIRVNKSGSISGWSLLADQVGSLVVDVWKLNESIPTVSNSVVGAGTKPTLSSQQINSSNTLTSWTLPVTVGDVFGFSVVSASSITRATLVVNF